MKKKLILYILSTVCFSILAVTVILVSIVSYQYEQNVRSNLKNNNKIFFYPIILLLVISIPLAVIMYKTYNTANKADIINNSLRENISSISPHSTLISTDYNEDDEKFEINAAFRTTKNLSSDNIRQMENFLELKLGKAVKLYADVVLIQKVDNKNSLNSFDDGTSESSYDGFNNIANYWSWKVDVVIMLIVIGVNVYFWV